MPPLLIPALVVSTVVSTGISIASAAGAFDPPAPPLPEEIIAPKVPTASDPEVKAARRERVKAQRRTAIFGQGEEFTPTVGGSTVLG